MTKIRTTTARKPGRKGFDLSTAQPQVDELAAAAEAILAAQERMDAALDDAMDAGVPTKYVAAISGLSATTVDRRKAAVRAARKAGRGE